MRVRLYDEEEGQFLRDTIFSGFLSEGETLATEDGPFYVVAVGPLQVDWEQNVLFQPVVVHRQRES